VTAEQLAEHGFRLPVLVEPAAAKASKIARGAPGSALSTDMPKFAVPSAYSETRSPVFRPKVR
jgi:hypothetical protein